MKLIKLFVFLSFIVIAVCLSLVPLVPPVPSNWRGGVNGGDFWMGAFSAPSPYARAVASSGSDGQPKRCLVAATGVWVELMDGTYVPASWEHPHSCFVNWLWWYVPTEG